MIETIISNNCSGAAVMHELGMEFKTPTINLQILPEQFNFFCRSLAYYMSMDLVECSVSDLTEEHKEYLTKMFGGVPVMPFGLLDDILVCFQHYSTFAEAKQKWDERKARVDYDHIGFMFHARGPEYKAEAETFLKLDLKNKICITEGFVIPGSVALYPKEGDTAFSMVNGKLLITQITDYKLWREWGC